jgi:DMSO/TMAO reductase YedYZ molybdopterin-dependent catalytic subunit
VVGLAALLVGLGVAELVAGLVRSWRSPVLDVGDRVVDGVPGWVAKAAIDLFGTADKAALLIGIGLLLVLYAAGAGVLAVRRGLVPGAVAVALFGVVGALAATTGRSARSFPSVVPSLVGAAAAVGALALLLTFLPVAGRAEASEGRRRRGDGEPAPGAAVVVPGRGVADRRLFLGVAAGLGAVAVGLALAGRRLADGASAVASRAMVVLPRPDRALPAPELDAITVPVAGVTPFFTPNADFYRIDTALVVPQVPVDTWTLRVEGMVDRPFELTYDELLARPMVEADVTLACVSNEVGGDLVGTARWLGVRLDDLLAEAGVSPRADQVVGRSTDGFACGFPVAALDGRDALVAVGMNGEPLPVRHGFPARLVVPGLYGYVSATKWLTAVELTRFDEFESYWVPRGWAVEGPIKLQSRIDTPGDGDRVAPGTVPVAGVAWHPIEGVSAVEVRVDEGPWQRAELAAELTGTTWRQWWFAWEAEPGRHTLEVRALDAGGRPQTGERSRPAPDGATGWHRIDVEVEP